MRVSERLLTIIALALALAGCGRSGDEAETSAPLSAPPSASPHAPPGPGASSMAPQMSQAPYGVVAEVSYTGDAATLGADAKVYIFLREKGARMPLSVQYFDARDLPKSASFTGPEPLSNVELVARLSMSGRVEKSPGDPETSVWIEEAGHPPKTVELRLGDDSGTGAAASSEPGPQAQATPAVHVHALVTIDSAEGLAPDAPVFVIARDGHNPMPLAVKKLAVRDLPATVELSDDDAMLFSHRLSGAASFTLLARVSSSGRAEPSPGDPESPPVQVDATAVPEQVTLAIHGS